MMLPPCESLHSHVADGYNVDLPIRTLRLSNFSGRINVLRFQIPRDLRSWLTCAYKAKLKLEKYNEKKRDAALKS